MKAINLDNGVLTAHNNNVHTTSCHSYSFSRDFKKKQHVNYKYRTILISFYSITLFQPLHTHESDEDTKKNSLLQGSTEHSLLVRVRFVKQYAVTKILIIMSPAHATHDKNPPASIRMNPSTIPSPSHVLRGDGRQ